MATFSTRSFASRHLGINNEELSMMLEEIGVNSLDQLIEETVPQSIKLTQDLDLSPALSEYEYLKSIKQIASKNMLYRNFIGQGYYGTITPSVILRNIFENPGWYTQYTPYQAEIAQGRLEALLNFQTMVADLTGMPLANASLLDEATAAAEAMSMFYGIVNKKRKKNPAKKIFIDQGVLQQTIDVVTTRAYPLDLEIVIGDWQAQELDDTYFAALLQYPNTYGAVEDYRNFCQSAHEHGLLVGVSADILSLSLLEAPGEWGADAVYGTTQRLGIPMGFGGPHAAYFATKEDYKRQIPGRVIGISVDRHGNPALRMALQTREQHIKREKATSNICTAQALLAIMAGMYACYHGKDGLVEIATRIHGYAQLLANTLIKMGVTLREDSYFDTITIQVNTDDLEQLQKIALAHETNFNYGQDYVSISIDETHDEKDIQHVIEIFTKALSTEAATVEDINTLQVPPHLQRSTDFMSHPVFFQYRTETKMMRYIKSLENKDLSLVHAMIALGSCTMKLNAATELMPVSYAEFGALHPFAPLDQCSGYLQIFKELEEDLCEITGFTACSLQPNSGAQGEFSGLLVIKAYHENNNDHHRNIALIPSSAHGTNPASAVMMGMKVVIVRCDDAGNIDLEDLKEKAIEHSDNLAALMVTYPSTHGVFETAIQEICDLIHEHGGMVYMDGANMNAQVGLTSPARIGADVCHLNLHKTFAIPHGGGGPGMGPICCNDKLKPFLPGHFHKNDANRAVSAAPWGSASILLISHAYVKMLGAQGVTDASRYAILNANYIKSKLENDFSVLYVGDKGRSAHELIIDLRMYKPLNIGSEDVAKRMIDYGFHAPTMSFPVPGTIMIEPTESEDKDELDRFCEAMLSIKKEIDAIATGDAPAENNVMSNAPHTLEEICSDEWPYEYTREQAAFPLSYLKEGKKFWPAVARVDNAYGDRNLVCTCPPIESYMTDEVS